jgi:hypothetical protein
VEYEHFIVVVSWVFMGIFLSAVLDVESVVLENHKQENNKNNKPDGDNNRLNFKTRRQ